VEEDSNISTVALRVALGDEKGANVRGYNLAHPVPGRYVRKYTDLALQMVGVSKLR
jgi:hypothetical protein